MPNCFSILYAKYHIQIYPEIRHLKSYNTRVLYLHKSNRIFCATLPGSGIFHRVGYSNAVYSNLSKKIIYDRFRCFGHNSFVPVVILNDEVIGIAMFAIDLGTIYGLLDQPGYGTVMGFYIKPNHRRKGFGRMFFEHIQTVLKKDGATKMYVCPDSVTGIPFWRTMGFSDSWKI